MSEAILIARKLDDGMYVSIEQVNELKAKLEAENESLKARLENAMATVAFNHLDAATRERRLERALWLARAWRADDMYRIFCFSSHIAEPMNIRGFIERFKGCSNMRSSEEWQQVWSRVERKCLKKAEEYK